MKTLFNEYDAMTPLAQEISINSGKFAQEIADAYPDISTRELESIIAGSVMTQLAEIRLRRAMNKRKAERSQRKADREQQKKENTYQDSVSAKCYSDMKLKKIK
jgi:hypothetical protein